MIVRPTQTLPLCPLSLRLVPSNVNQAHGPAISLARARPWELYGHDPLRRQHDLFILPGNLAAWKSTDRPSRVPCLRFYDPRQ